MVKVSVLIPAYNVEPYIRECLDSVIGQTFSDWEMICVDDASTDRTLSVLRDYEAADARIRVLAHDKNQGQSCGRNLALSYASGEYVYMLDADDMIIPEALGELYQLCTEERLDVVGFETSQFAEDASFHRQAAVNTITYQEEPVTDGRNALIGCMERESFSLSVPTFFMRRAYLEKNGIRFVEGILHEDVGYLFDLICRAQRVRFLHKKYFLRRIRAHSTMTGGFTSANIEGYLKSFLRSFELEGELRQLYGNDSAFWDAVGKWRRDIFGRLRQLYRSAEDIIYHQEGGKADEEIRRLFEVVKLTTPGKAQAEDILGADTCSLLSSLSSGSEAAPEIYICGTGQYAERAIGLAGALGAIIRGVLVTEKSQNSFCGFPVYEIREAQNTSLPVLVSVSHYTRGEYERALRKTGYTEFVYPGF